MSSMRISPMSGRGLSVWARAIAGMIEPMNAASRRSDFTAFWGGSFFGNSNRCGSSSGKNAGGSPTGLRPRFCTQTGAEQHHGGIHGRSGRG